MSKRQAVMDAFGAALVAAFPGAEVAYWREPKPVAGEALVCYRDTAASYTKVNTRHEHAVRVEVESYVFGEELGPKLIAELNTLIQTIGANRTLGIEQCFCELEASSFDSVGDGYEAGLCALVVIVKYQTAAFAGA